MSKAHISYSSAFTACLHAMTVVPNVTHLSLKTCMQVSIFSVDIFAHFPIHSHMAMYNETPLDRTFHALGDATRRRMLGMLAQHGSRTASQLGAPFKISQPSVSKHLKTLENAGLIGREVIGRVHSFTLNSAPLEDADSWINRHRKFWRSSLDQLGTLVDEVNKEDVQND